MSAAVPVESSKPRKLDVETKKLVYKILVEIEEADINGYFCYPITDDIAPGYSSIIEYPMDLSTIR